MKIYKKTIIFFCLITALILPQAVFGSELDDNPDNFTSPADQASQGSNPALQKLNEIGAGQGPYREDVTLLGIVGTVVGVALSFLGIIFLLLMIFAGYNWMTAQGEEEKVSKAKDTIARSIIGLIIVLGSYAVWKFILSKLF